ncbi:MAG: DUF4738 domain-containing protein [Prevotella sp.]|nr:DUF4738 domain-containing protein [Prevotella sp.]
MKKLIPILLAVGIMMLGACKEKKQSEEIITTKYVPKKPGAPVSMPPKETAEQVSWAGKPYEVKISRAAVDSLPMVANEIGQKYVDNRITLTILRGDGSVFFSKSFSKASFLSYLTADYRRDGLLTDMRFKDVKGSELNFIVTIAEPEATDDEFLPLALSVNRDGGIGIKVEDDLDFLINRDDYDEEP